MALLDTWRNLAYQTEMDNKTANEFWGSYFTQEKAIYEQILADPDTVVKGTVKELADKYGVEVLLMTGFLDGINDSLKTPNPIETMEEDTEVSLDYDKEKLYYNMVACKADWLYELPQWITFLMKLQEKIYTRSRSYQELSLRARRLDVMIHVLAEAVRSTNSAVERTLNW